MSTPAERSILVRLRVELTDYKRQMADAASVTDKMSAQFDANGKRIETTSGRLIRSAELNADKWRSAGRSLMLFGTASLAALALTTHAAVEWESAWAGVLKTVDASAAGYERLERGLRDLALTLPASQTEIANTAALLGQLGIQADAIVPLTKVMIDLGETTNLTAEEAATSLARIANIMGLTTEEISRAGSTIVELGNNSATTEREITELTLRMAAAAKQAGLSAADAFAFASALSSVGVEAEAGGTAFSKVFTSVADAVRSGNDNLAVFARVAGMSVREFSEAFENDAPRAIAAFVEGMGRMSSAGESTTEIFSTLGLADERLKRAVLSVGSAQGLLTAQLDMGNKAWTDNNALVEEAEKRYDTTAAKVQIARNSLNEAAISIGENLLPILATAAEGLAKFFQGVASLPEPLQNIGIGAVGATAGVTLLAGAVLTTVPRLIGMYTAMRELERVNPGLASGLSRVGRGASTAAVGLAAALVAIEGIEAINKSLIADAPGIGATTKAMLDLAEGTKTAEEAFADWDWNGNQNGFKTFLTGSSIDLASYQDTLDAAIYSQQSFWEQLRRGPDNFNKTEQEQALRFFEGFDTTLANLVQSGNADQARAAMERLNIPLEYQAKLLPNYVDALASVENQEGLNADAYDASADAIYDYNAALTENIALQRDASGVALSEWDAVTRFADAVMTATEALYDENGALIEQNRTLDANTEAGRSNRDALAGIVDSTWDWIEAGDAAGVSVAELQSRMEESRQKFIDTAIQMGLTRDEAEALADEMGLIPAAITTDVQLTGYTETYQYLMNIQTALSKMSGTKVRIGMGAGGSGGLTFADGGPVYGPGSSTSDSIAAWLSNNEHVWSASEVAGAGGHAAVEALRLAARRGDLFPRFADGGAVMAAQARASAALATLTSFTGRGTPPPAVGGNTFQIYEQSDPAATAQDVVRRLEMMGA